MMNDNAAIRQAVRTVAFDDALAEHLGLNPTDLRCFELVIADPDLTPSRLAELAGLTTGAVTGVVDRLERAGYVVRRPDPADRRSVTIAPVPARAGEVGDALAPLTAAIDDLLGACSAEQRDAIGGFLDASARAVEEETARLRVGTRGGFVGNRFTAPLGGRDARAPGVHVRRAAAGAQHRPPRPARERADHRGDQRLTARVRRARPPPTTSCSRPSTGRGPTCGRPAASSRSATAASRRPRSAPARHGSPSTARSPGRSSSTAGSPISPAPSRPSCSSASTWRAARTTSASTCPARSGPRPSGSAGS